MKTNRLSPILRSVALTVQLAAAGAAERSGLTILSKNNLDQKTIPGSSAILVHQPSDHVSATEACNDLSEELWAYDAALFDQGVDSALAYQLQIGQFDSSARFWITGNSTTECLVISVKGELVSVPCEEQHPALCTQSAPVSSPGEDDTSPEYQITQQVGGMSLTGYRDAFTWKFLGVRFAPTPKRFEYSTPLEEMKGNFSALEYGASCLQPRAEVLEGASDDCLFVNIWTPFIPSGSGDGEPRPALKPVMVYLHGGGLSTGTSNNPNTDGTNFASRADIVQVSVNYRLGNLGYIAFDDGVHNGNIGLGDQINALKWVAENVAYFGGDPNRVTLAGESAGAVSTRMLLTSPLAKGFFQQAMMRSDVNGGFGAFFGNFLSVEESYQQTTVPLLEHTGCSDAEDAIACLRAVDGIELAEAPYLAMAPVVDGTYLTRSNLPLNGTDPGYVQDIPVMTGITENEGGVYLNWVPLDEDVTFEEWFKALSALNVDGTPAVEHPELFGLGSDPTTQDFLNAAERLITLSGWTCLEKAKIHSATLHGAFKTVYGWTFNRTYSVPSFTNEWCDAKHDSGNPEAGMDYWKCHGGDQVVAFGNIIRAGLPDRDGRDVEFSQLIVDYWSSFLWTGNPNPDQELLAVRGFESTLGQVRSVGQWKPASDSEWMILEWDGHMQNFEKENEVCNVMGQPLDFWEP